MLFGRYCQFLGEMSLSYTRDDSELVYPNTAPYPRQVRICLLPITALKEGIPGASTWGTPSMRKLLAKAAS